MSAISEQTRQGLALKDERIIDCHTHMGPWHNFHNGRGSPEAMLAVMDRTGIDIACVTAMAAVGPDMIYGNDVVMEAAARYPDRFICYATINPHYPKLMERELDRCFAFPGTRAIKLHPAFHGVPIDYKAYRPAYERAERERCPVLIHVWGKADVAAVDRLADEYPDAVFLMGHAGAVVRAMEDAIDVVNRHKNVVVDLALSLTYEGNVEWLVGEMGSDKVLFGSDMPFFDPRPTLGRIGLARISDEDKRNVLGRNMQRLLRLEDKREGYSRK